MRRIQRQHRDRLLLAYQTAALIGFSKLPPIKELLRKLEPAEPAQQLPSEEIMRRMDLWRMTIARAQPPTS